MNKINLYDIFAVKTARKVFLKGVKISAVIFLLLGVFIGWHAQKLMYSVNIPAHQSKLNQEVSYYESVLLDLNRYKDLVQELETLEPGISPKMIVRWKIIHLENALLKKIKLCSAKEQSFLMRYFQHFHARKQAAWE